MGFLVASALARPGIVAWANNLKLGADLAIVVTLVVTIVLKLDLRSEVLSASDYGIALVVVNVGVPLSLLAYYCVPTLLGRSTLGDASRARQVFELLDVDGTGVVTREQVRQLLRATHSIQVGDATTVVSEDELDDAFASIADPALDTPTAVSAADWHAYLQCIYSTSGERQACQGPHPPTSPLRSSLARRHYNIL